MSAAMRVRLGWAIVAGAALACDSGPKSGDLTLALETTHTTLGAALFKVTALEPHTILDAAAACAGCKVFTVQVSEREIRGAVTGPFSAGPLLYVTVSDRTVGEAYTATLLQLAQPGHTLVGLSGSSLRLRSR